MFLTENKMKILVMLFCSGIERYFLSQFVSSLCLITFRLVYSCVVNIRLYNSGIYHRGSQLAIWDDFVTIILLPMLQCHLSTFISDFENELGRNGFSCPKLDRPAGVVINVVGLFILLVCIHSCSVDYNTYRRPINQTIYSTAW